MTGLTNGVVYSFQVRAADSRDNGAASATVSVIPLGGPSGLTREYIYLGGRVIAVESP